MKDKIIKIDKLNRLNLVIEKAWDILFQQILNKRVTINKESSLQLHFSKLIYDLGNIYCIWPDETFGIEMETDYGKKNIDIVCFFRENSNIIKAAIELKCFMKKSNRAKDIDGYDALKDIERLENFEGFAVRKFICLTDNKYYAETEQTGHGKSVSLKHGTIYLANKPITPTWTWNIKRDEPILFRQDIRCNWVTQDSWHFLKIDVK